MARINFASITTDQNGYCIDTMAWSERATVAAEFQWFQVLGDGMCQHSGEYNLQPAGLVDYLYSLAAHLAATPGDVDKAGFRLGPKYGGETFAFCATVIYREGKERYYSLAEKKISAAPAKANDRRYEKIESWMDGKFEATVRLLSHGYHSGWDQFQLRYEARNWYYGHAEIGGGSPDQPATSMHWATLNCEAREFTDAYAAVLAAIEAANEAQHARRAVAGYLRQVEWAREQAVTDVA